MFIRESGDNDFDKALHRRKHVTLSINTCTYDLSNSIYIVFKTKQNWKNAIAWKLRNSDIIPIFVAFCMDSMYKIGNKVNVYLCKSRSMYCHYGYRFCIQRQNRTTVKQIVYLRGLMVVVIFRLLWSHWVEKLWIIYSNFKVKIFVTLFNSDILLLKTSYLKF